MLIVRAVVGVCAKLLCHGAASVRCVAFPSALHNLLHEHTANLTCVAHQLQIIKKNTIGVIAVSSNAACEGSAELTYSAHFARAVPSPEPNSTLSLEIFMCENSLG